MNMRYILLETVLFIVGSSVTALSGLAATYTVTNTNDSGPGSLREAVAAAKSTSDNDVIVFDISGCPEGVCTIVLTSGQLVTATYPFNSGTLTISNPAGPRKLIVSGNNTSPIFYASFNASLKIDGLTLKHALSSEPWSGAVELNSCCSLVIANSEIVENTGRGISFAGGDMLVLNSTVAHNTGGGVTVVEGYTARFINSTLTGNTSPDYGGAVTLIDSWAEFINVTITNNSAPAGGGVGGTTGGYGGSAFYVRNSIISGNSAAVAPDVTDELTWIIDLGNNIIGQPALLGPLADNGGPTRTHALLTGSPAINAGNNCVLTENGCGNGNPALPTDQRGFGRSGAVDIGAFELQAEPPTTNVSVSGRVIGPTGRGLANVTVTLMDTSGNRRSAQTNPFGFYQFTDVSAPGTYTLTAISRRYQFDPQVISVNGDVTDVNFVAQAP